MSTSSSIKLVTISGFICWNKQKWEGNPPYYFVGASLEVCKMMKATVVCPHSITFELPETFNPVALQIAEIEGKKEEATAKYHALMVRLNGELSNLLCIENGAEL